MFWPTGAGAGGGAGATLSNNEFFAKLFLTLTPAHTTDENPPHAVPLRRSTMPAPPAATPAWSGPLRSSEARRRILFHTLGQNPKSSSVPARHLKSRAAAIGENKQRALARVLAQALGGQPVQPIETLAQVAWLQADEHFEAARKTQHEAEGFAHARSNAGANSRWRKSEISIRALLPNRTTNPEAFWSA
jgi:hypothetical protein